MPIIRSLQQLTLAYVTRVRVQDSGPEKACEIRYRKWDGTCVVRVFCVWSLVCFRLIFLASSQIFHVFSNCSELIFYRFIPKTTDFPRVSLSHPHKTDVIKQVITTYATLGSDFSKATQATRHGSGFAEQFCPLLTVNWWRVVLDESHTVWFPFAFLLAIIFSTQ